MRYHSRWAFEQVVGFLWSLSLQQWLSWIWFNNKTVLLRDMVHQISRRGVRGCRADRPRTPRDVKNTTFNQYLPGDLTSLNVSNSRFRKPVMFWRWRRHGLALWRHGRGAWHNCLLLATASNVNCWADVANHVTWLWQAGDTENLERRITG